MMTYPSLSADAPAAAAATDRPRVETDRFRAPLRVVLPAAFFFDVDDFFEAVFFFGVVFFFDGLFFVEPAFFFDEAFREAAFFEAALLTDVFFVRDDDAFFFDAVFFFDPARVDAFFVVVFFAVVFFAVVFRVVARFFDDVVAFFREEVFRDDDFFFEADVFRVEPRPADEPEAAFFRPEVDALFRDRVVFFFEVVFFLAATAKIRLGVGSDGGAFTARVRVADRRQGTQPGQIAGYCVRSWPGWRDRPPARGGGAVAPWRPDDHPRSPDIGGWPDDAGMGRCNQSTAGAAVTAPMARNFS